MHREIKFRAWNGEQMVYEGGKSFAGYMHSYQILSNYETVMQFIGWQDKNAKEIYEGDILRIKTKVTVWLDDDDFLSESIEVDQEITAQVVYNVEIAGFELLTIESDEHLKSWGFYEGEDVKDFEIIGNIFSNPELLS